MLARYATNPEEAEQLQTMSGLDEAGREAYRERVASRRRSVLELLDDFPSCDLPFNVYLELLPPMRPRYYSISSSPAVASSCHLTVGVLHGPARSGDGYFNGVASNHLASSMEGSTQFAFVRKPTIPFRPPANPHTPMIMVGAGTGMAPSVVSCKNGPRWRRRASPSASRSSSTAAETPSTTCSTPTS